MPSRRSLRKFLVGDFTICAICLAVALPIYWLFSYSGPLKFLSELELQWVDRSDRAIIMIGLMAGLAYAIQGVAWMARRWLPGEDDIETLPAPSGQVIHPASVAHPVSDTHAAPHKTPTYQPSHSAQTSSRATVRGRSPIKTGWDIAALIAAIGTAILLVMAIYYAVLGKTRGELSNISALSLERGATPASKWLDVSGIVMKHAEVDVEYQRRGRSWHQFYVPLISGEHDPAIEPAVFLCVDQKHERRFFSQRDTFSGTLAPQSLPNDVIVRFEKKGVHPASGHILINFGENPAELLDESWKLVPAIITLAVTSLILWLIGRVRGRIRVR